MMTIPIGRKRLVWCSAVATISLLCIVIGIPTACSGQDESSLDQAARQVRAERAQRQKQQTSQGGKGSQSPTLIIDQTAEEKESVPDGFGTYEASGYRLALPAPFSAIGRDDRGTLLATDEVTGVTTKVFAGEPIPITKHPTQMELAAILTESLGEYGKFPCGRFKPGELDHRCAAYGVVFGNQFRGEARIIDIGDRLIPVVCFATTLPDEQIDMKKIYSQRAETAQKLKTNMDRHSMAAYSYSLCPAVLDSIHPGARTLVPKTPMTRVTFTQPRASAETGSDTPSLGEIARATKNQVTANPKIKVDGENTVGQPPAGFRIRSSMRCISATECWQERLFLPQNARRVTGGNSDNVYVVGSDGKTSMVIYFGTIAVSYGYSDYGSAAEVAYKWIHAHPDYSAKPVTSVRTVNGQTVEIEQRRLLASLNAWTEESGQVGSDPVKFKVACIAREDHFADQESVCAAVLESWRLDPQ